MFGFLGRVFGTDRAVNNLIDKDTGLISKVGEWIGNKEYTEEERAEANGRTREWGLSQLEAIHPFKVIQRILAFASAGLWLFVGLNLIVAIWVRALTEGRVDAAGIALPSVDAVQPLLDLALSDYVFWPVITVYALYFSGGVIESIKSRLAK